MMLLRKLFKPVPRPYVYTWESEPFVFQKGAIYVIEVDTDKIELKEAQGLKQFFQDEGVTVKLVLTKDGHALKPITVKRRKEEV